MVGQVHILTLHDLLADKIISKEGISLKHILLLILRNHRHLASYHLIYDCLNQLCLIVDLLETETRRIHRHLSWTHSSSGNSYKKIRIKQTLVAWLIICIIMDWLILIRTLAFLVFSRGLSLILPFCIVVNCLLFLRAALKILIAQIIFLGLLF